MFIYNKESKAQQLVFFLIMILVSILLSGFISNIITTTFFNIDITSADFINSTSSTKNYVNALRISQAFNTIGIFIAPSLFFLFHNETSKETILKKNKNIGIVLVLSVVLMFQLKPLTSFLINLNTNIDFKNYGGFISDLANTSDLLTEKLKLITYSDTSFMLIVNIVVVALLPAIGEELFFRGIIQRKLSLMYKGKIIPVFISALLFALMHFNVKSFIPILFLGMVLGYIYSFTKNILISIIAHFVNNAWLLITLYVANTSFTQGGIDVSLVNVLFHSLISMLLFYFIYKFSENN